MRAEELLVRLARFARFAISQKIIVPILQSDQHSNVETKGALLKNVKKMVHQNEPSGLRVRANKQI